MELGSRKRWVRGRMGLEKGLKASRELGGVDARCCCCCSSGGGRGGAAVWCGECSGVVLMAFDRHHENSWQGG